MVLLSALLLAALAPMTWQTLPGWARPQRVGDIAMRTVDGGWPVDRVRTRRVAAYAFQGGVPVRVGNGTPADAGNWTISLYSTAIDLTPEVDGALWLNRDLNVLWAGRRREIAAALEQALERIGGALREGAAEIADHPRFDAVYLPRFRAVLEDLLDNEDLEPARDRALAAVRLRVETEYLPVYREILVDTLRKAVEGRIRIWLGEVYRLLSREDEEVVDPDGLFEEVRKDPRTAGTARRMAADLFFRPEVLDYAGLLTERVIAGLAKDPAVRGIVTDMAADPAFGTQFDRLGERLEIGIREIVAAAVLTPDRRAIDPLAAIALRGAIGRDNRGFLLLRLSADPAPALSALKPHAAAVLER